MDEQTTPTQPSAERPLDRTHAPAVPPAVGDLWRTWGYNGDPQDAGQVRVALDGVTSIVNAMAGGDLYRVGLTGQIATAGTDLKGRSVVITTAALADRRLTLAERLAVTTALAVHEAGHARLTGPMARAVTRRWGEAGASRESGRAHRLSNIVEDVRLEDRTSATFGAYAGLFPLAMWWVAQRYPSGKIDRLPETRDEMVSLALAAIRYGVHTKWGTDAALVAERDWWTAWGLSAAQHDRPKDHVAALEAALDRINGLPEAKPQPEVPSQSQPGQSGEGEAGDPDPDADGYGEAPEADEPPQMPSGGWGQADEDEDPDEDDDADGAGSEGEGDEDEDGEGDEADEDALDAPSAGNGSGEATDEDADEDTSADDADGDADGWGDDADEDEAEDIGSGSDDDEHTTGDEVTYKHRDGDESIEVEGEQDEPDGSLIYGETDATEVEATEQDADDRDALADPLPAHGSEAATDDDRNRDVTLGREMAMRAQVESRDRITVTHPSDQQVEVINVVPLVTERERITTDKQAQGALRAAFTSRRTARDNRNVARSGRVSGHRAYRVAAGFDTVFTRRDGVSPDRLDIHLLVDASGSMSSRATSRGWGTTGPKRVTQASQMAANIVEALQALPYVRLHVWAHNTAIGAVLHDVWDSRRGEPVGRIGGITTAGGNKDGTVIAGLATRIVKERGNREQSVLVVISDGAPCEDEARVRDAAASARKAGVGVVSVAIAGGLTKTQEACYGADSVVPWTGDWDDLSRNIARIMGRLG